MERSFARFRASTYFAGLNGIRCLAIVMVVWHHAYGGPIVVLGRGFLGVDLFFVLSGFLIVTLLLREREATGTISLRDFWVRRALRLAPPFYLLLALLAVKYGLHPHDPHSAAFFASLPANMVYLSNWRLNTAPNLDILWSLATEEQFYLIWPLVELALAALAWPLLGAFLLLNQLVNFGLVDGIVTAILPHPERYSILASTYTPICLGVALARLLHRPRSHARIAAVLGRRSAPIALAAAIVALIALAPADIAGAPRLAIQLAMAGLIGSIVLQPRCTLTRVLERRAIARIGTISYGMYLYHLWCLQAARTILGPAEPGGVVALFVIELALTIAVAEISFRIVEQPILAFARKFRTARKPGVLERDPSMASHPDTHPDSAPRSASDSPKRVSPANDPGRESVEDTPGESSPGS